MPAPETDGEGVFLLDAAMKAQQWERAKGELRALVAIQGSYRLGRGPGDHEPAKWEQLERAVNKFIDDVETEGLQE